MWRKNLTMVALAGLVLAVAAPGTMAQDKAKPEKDIKKERVINRVIVRTGEDGEPQVFRIGPNGPMQVRRGFIGLTLTELSPELREHFGVPADSGVIVSRVEPDSPALKAGVRVGDIITGVDGQKVDGSNEITRAIRRKKDGEAATLELWRDRKVRTLTVHAAERDVREFEMGEVFLGPNSDFRFEMDPKQAEEHAKRMAELEKRLEKQFNSPEFRRRIERQVDESRRVIERQRELEKKLEEMQRRLEEMQKKLQERSSRHAAPSEG